MAVYLLKHPSADFTGYIGGADFYNGQGSTSSLQDARLFSEKGYLVYDEQGRQILVEVRINPETRLEILEPKPVAPIVESQGAGEADASPASLSQPQEVGQPKPRAKPGRKPKALK